MQDALFIIAFGDCLLGSLLVVSLDLRSSLLTLGSKSELYSSCSFAALKFSRSSTWKALM